MVTTFDVETVTEEQLKEEFNRLSFATAEKNVNAPRFEVVDEAVNGVFTLDVYPEGERSLKYTMGYDENDWVALLNDPELYQKDPSELIRINEEGIRYTLALTINKLEKEPLLVTYSVERLMTSTLTVLADVEALFKQFKDRTIYANLKTDTTDLPF